MTPKSSYDIQLNKIFTELSASEKYKEAQFSENEDTLLFVSADPDKYPKSFLVKPEMVLQDDGKGVNTLNEIIEQAREAGFTGIMPVLHLSQEHATLIGEDNITGKYMRFEDKKIGGRLQNDGVKDMQKWIAMRTGNKLSA